MMFHLVVPFRQLAGTKRLEEESIATIEQVIDKMLKKADSPIDMKYYILLAVYDMVMILVFGKRYCRGHRGHCFYWWN